MIFPWSFSYYPREKREKPKGLSFSSTYYRGRSFEGIVDKFLKFFRKVETKKDKPRV